MRVQHNTQTVEYSLILHLQIFAFFLIYITALITGALSLAYILFKN